MSAMSGWRWMPLAAVAPEARDSLTPSPGTQYELWSIPAFADGRPEILDGGQIRSSKRRVEPGDVLLSKINPRINRVWHVGPRKDRDQIASPEWLVLRPRTAGLVSPDFLRYYLSAPAFRNWIVTAVSGVTGSHTRAKAGAILERLAPVPPVPEQRRIVEILDDHLSRLDAGVGYLTAAQQRALRARQGLLDELWIDAPLRPVSDVGQVITGSTPSTKLGDVFGDHCWFLTPGDLGHGHRVDVATRSLSELGARNARSAPAGSVLVVCIGATIGKVGWVDRTVSFNQQINAVVPSASTLRPEFLAAVASSRGFQNQIKDAASSTTMPILNKRKFSSLVLACPSLEEQDLFLIRLREVEGGLGSLREASADASRRAANLRASLLSAACSGRLTGAPDA